MSNHSTLPSVDDFTAWLTAATPGEQFQYHEGDLFADRQFHISRLGTEGRFQLSQLADAAYQAAKQNQVLLVQKRLGTSQWAYIAIKRRTPSIKRPTLRLITNPNDLEKAIA